MTRSQTLPTARETRENAPKSFLKLATKPQEPPAFATDERGRIVSWNETVGRLLGVSKEQALGRAVATILSSEVLEGRVGVSVLDIPGARVYLLQPAAEASAPSPAPWKRAGADCPISARELGILELLSNGYAAINIAARLNLSHATVRNHIQNILRKLDVHGQVEAVSLAFRRGWIGAPAAAGAVVPMRPAAPRFLSAAC